MNVCVVIPARMHSTRLPGKMLLRETGRTLIEHTHAAARRAKLPAAVLVATDHPAIYDEVRRFGGEPVMTREDHASGADRVAEVAAERDEFDAFLNVQGDEPEIDPEAIDRLVTLLIKNPTSPMATLAAPMTDATRIADPANVKVVFDHRGRAMYFSREPIPHVRDAGSRDAVAHYHHVGLYGYRREFLLGLPAIPPSPLEKAERLEQLRVLQAGHAIQVGVIPAAASGIDTPEDYAAFVRRQSRRAA